MGRIADPRTALDFPNLPLQTWVVFSAGGPFVWPDARRRGSYLSATKRHTLRGWALWTPHWAEAAQFATEGEARTWLREQENRRGAPYGAQPIQVSSIIRDHFNGGDPVAI